MYVWLCMYVLYYMWRFELIQIRMWINVVDHVQTGKPWISICMCYPSKRNPNGPIAIIGYSPWRKIRFNRNPQLRSVTFGKNIRSPVEIIGRLRLGKSLGKPEGPIFWTADFSEVSTSWLRWYSNYPLVMTNIANWKMTIVNFPIRNGEFA